MHEHTVQIREKIAGVDRVMGYLVDFHSHILPMCDDGSDSVETSLKMLELSAAQGVRHLFATPHFYAHKDSLEVFLERRARGESVLRETMHAHPQLPDFTVGAEVYYFRGMSESESLHQLTLGNTPYILVEMPVTAWKDSMYRELEQIHEKQGITPLIAHVERYFGAISTHGILERLSALPVLVQSNAEFFLDRKTSAKAIRLLKKGQIHLLGSDCHNLTSRVPNLGPAMELIIRRAGENTAGRIHSIGNAIFADGGND